MDRFIKESFIRSVWCKYPLILDDKYWDYYLQVSEKDYGYQTSFTQFCSMIKDVFNDNVNDYEAETQCALYKLSDALILYKPNFPKLKWDSLSNEIQSLYHGNINKMDKNLEFGKYYLSVDLKESCIQVIDYYKLFGDKAFDDIIESEIYKGILEWKGNRISAWDKAEEYIGHVPLLKMEYTMLSKILTNSNEISDYIKDKSLPLTAIRGDEMLLELPIKTTIDDFLLDFPLTLNDWEIEDIKFHLKIIKYDHVHFKINGKEKYASFNENCSNGQRNYITKSCSYLHQLNKLYNGEDLSEMDLVIRDGSGYRPFIDKIEIIRD